MSIRKKLALRLWPGAANDLAVSIQRLTLKEGDALVVHCDRLLSRVQIDARRQTLEGAGPACVKVLILDSGLRLSVYGKATDAQA